MEYNNQLREAMHEFSLRLATLLEQRKIGTQDAGYLVLKFRTIIEEHNDISEVKRFIEKL